MEKIVAMLAKGKVLISDGAWGTFLQKKGLAPGECPELWNIDHRSEVLDIAKSYIAAGADMIESDSFGRNAIQAGALRPRRTGREINRAAAQISRAAAGPDGHVIAHRPTGKMLITGDVTEDELYELSRSRLRPLKKAGGCAVHRDHERDR